MRASLPTSATTITPGYSKEIVLDVAFDGERPTDWGEWWVRMHIWSELKAIRFKLQNEAGVTFNPIEGLIGAIGTVILPVILIPAAKTALLADALDIKYVIDLKAPGGQATDYFAGTIERVFTPPAELLG